ncbi:uncharacterized protein [Montipora capricornis]|uniref:uncharacterized protein n=1 Tax=Montipora capricornis TaxID=246305 RepID=UPI0035F1C003
MTCLQDAYKENVFEIIEKALALKEVSGGTRISGVRYANFIQDKFAYLNITPVRKRLLERSIQCALSCLDTLPCFSFNLAALQDNSDKLMCEHLPSDKYNNSDQFVASKVFHHLSILSPCSSWPCNGNGKCVALYAENSYLCISKTGFIGQNCENSMMNSVILSSDGFYFICAILQCFCPLSLEMIPGGNSVTEVRPTATIVKKNDFVFGGFTDIP